MPELKQQPTLEDFQKYVALLERERGFENQTVIEKCVLLGEEIGELFKAIRKTNKLAVDENTDFTSVEEELADILIYLCSIANRYQISLEEAFREKEKINQNRVWR